VADFSWTNAWVLLLIPVCVGFTVWRCMRATRRSAAERWLAGTLRCAGLILLILAMAGIGVRRRADVTATIFAVDMSDSASAMREDAFAAIRAAEEHRTGKDAAGAVAFGSGAVIDSIPALDNAVGTLHSHVGAGHTNIAAALSLAQSAFPEGMMRRIVLLSDGLENVDSALAAARTLREARIAVDVYPLYTEEFDEVQVVGITVPKHLNKFVEYEIETELYSTTENTAVLSVYKGNTLVASAEVTLRVGTNRFVFTDTADIGGGMAYRAEILSPRDRFTENNRAFAYGTVEDTPRVLLVDHKGSAAEMEKILVASRVEVTKMPSAAVPATVDRLNVYDAVILADTPLDALPPGFDAALESYVRNLGGGVLVTGGENSYALGGYYKTGLEALLPVEMRLKDSQDVPSLGMIVVMDRSGSMSGGNYGVSKLELAKEAVIRAVETLMPDDVFGVIAFDDGFEWIAPFQTIGGDIGAVQSRIANISLGGGTSILPGLQEAVNVLQNAETKLKHIILLTDGQAEQSGYDPVINRMLANGITLSSIAVGADADQILLKSLAESGGGRYYYTDEFTDLPQIFAKETTLAGKTYLNDRSFYPSVAVASLILTGIDALPMLDGYISTTAKPRADLVLASDTEEPILAAWQYGLGRTVAWMPDVSGRWTARWLHDAGGVSLLRNAVSWTLRTQTFANLSLDVTASGKDSVLTFTAPYADGITSVTGVLAAMDGAEQPIDFRATAPGVFSAVMPDLEPGAYVAGLTLAKADGTEHASLGVSVSYSAEYDMRRPERGAELLSKIAEITGGQILQSPVELYRPVAAETFAGVMLAPQLLWAALAVFLLDIASRRFPILSRGAERIFVYCQCLIREKKASIMILNDKKKQTVSASAKVKTPRSAAKPAEQSATKPVVQGTSSALLAQKKKRSKH